MDDSKANVSANIETNLSEESNGGPRKRKEPASSSPSSSSFSAGEPNLKRPKFSENPQKDNLGSIYRRYRQRIEQSANKKADPIPSQVVAKPKKAPVKKLFEYGNYSGYYGYRLDKDGNDPRISLMEESWFEGKKVLDIGCNSGVLTIKLAQEFNLESIKGIDIDPSLISKANKNLKEASKLNSHIKGKKKHVYYGGGKKDSSSNEDPELRMKTVLTIGTRVSFEVGDYLTMETHHESYETVICLSVIKWIHLNWGDKGLVQLLTKVHQELKPNGTFILEIQPLSSYKKVKSLNQTIKDNWISMKIHPEKIADLISEKFGFKLLKTLEPSTSNKGFSRPVHVFSKVGDITYESV